MRHFFLFSLSFFLLSSALAQSVRVGLFGGISNYQGDLVDKVYVSRFTRPAIGLTIGYELSDHVAIRGGFTYAKVAGDDKYNTKEYLQARNLNSQSVITEFSLLGEYSVFDLNTIKWTPYLFTGLALFHFNPYTTDANNQQIFLKPLSTEGQGLAQYPNVKPYALTQVAIPFGGGIKCAISDNVRIGFEVGIRKLFTDYLDDVSTSYAAAADLLAAKGQQSVNFAYRGGEVAGGSPIYPTKGTQRGGADQKDIYYFTGLHLSFRIGDGYGSGLGSSKGYGCPTVKF